MLFFCSATTPADPYAEPTEPVYTRDNGCKFGLEIANFPYKYENSSLALVTSKFSFWVTSLYLSHWSRSLMFPRDDNTYTSVYVAVGVQ